MTATELRKRRFALKLSAARLALLLGVSPASIHRWECGHPIPAYLEARLAEVERTRWPKRNEHDT